MKTIRIRTFTMLCFFFILSLPCIFLVTAHFMETKTLSFAKSQPQDETLQRQLSETIHLIETNPDKWKDPNWQNQLHTRLQKRRWVWLFDLRQIRKFFSPTRSDVALCHQRNSSPS